MNTDFYNPSKIFLIIAIGLLLSCFTGKAYDVVNDYDTLFKDDVITKNYDEYNNKKNEYNNKKTTYMLTIGFIYLVVGVIASKQIQSTSMTGISLGGLLLISYFLSTNWYKFSQMNQVLIIGGLLIGAIVVGLDKNLILM